MKRDGVRRPAGPVSQGRAPGRRLGLPPGSLRSPARSWLTTLGPKPNARDNLSRGALRAQEWRGAGNGVRIVGGAPMAKAGPAGPQSRRCWRAERRPRAARHPCWTALFGAPPPPQTPGARRVAARRTHVLQQASPRRKPGSSLPSRLRRELDTGFRRYDDGTGTLAPAKSSHYVPLARKTRAMAGHRCKRRQERWDLVPAGVSRPRPPARTFASPDSSLDAPEHALANRARPAFRGWQEKPAIIQAACQSC